MSTVIQIEKIPWDTGRLTGQKKALKLPEILKVPFHSELKPSARELAMFDLAIDSKLRGRDLIKLLVSDVTHGGGISKRATDIFSALTGVLKYSPHVPQPRWTHPEDKHTMPVY